MDGKKAGKERKGETVRERDYMEEKREKWKEKGKERLMRKERRKAPETHPEDCAPDSPNVPTEW